jgi:hypothetical protein
MEAAETSDMGDAHTVRETATSEMGDPYATAYGSRPTHAVAEAMTEAAVVRVATKYGGVAVVAAVPITVIIPA